MRLFAFITISLKQNIETSVCKIEPDYIYNIISGEHLEIVNTNNESLKHWTIESIISAFFSISKFGWERYEKYTHKNAVDFLRSLINKNKCLKIK